MKKLLPFLLAALLPFSAQAQRQAITVEPNGTGAGTVSTAGITYYYMGANTYDFTGSILVNGTLVASATAVYYQVSQANSFVAGQPVTVNGSGTWVGAFANGTLAQANAVGVVSSTGLSAGAFQVVIDGICPIGVSALTTGSIYYVPLSAGIVTSTAPSVAGQYVYPLATAISSNVLVVGISTPSIVSSFSVSLSGNNTWTGTNTFNNTLTSTGITSLGSSAGGISTPGMISIGNTNTVAGYALELHGSTPIVSNGGSAIQINTQLTAAAATTYNFENFTPTFNTSTYGGNTLNSINVGTPIVNTTGGGTVTGGYQINVAAPASGQAGALNIASGAVNLGSGLISTGGGGFAIGTTPSSSTSLIVKQVANSNLGAAQFMRSDNSHYFAFYMGGDDNAYFDARTGGASKIEFYSNSGAQQAEIDPGFGLRLLANGGAVGNLSVAGTATVNSVTAAQASVFNGDVGIGVIPSNNGTVQLEINGPASGAIFTTNTVNYALRTLMPASGVAATMEQDYSGAFPASNSQVCFTGIFALNDTGTNTGGSAHDGGLVGYAANAPGSGIPQIGVEGRNDMSSTGTGADAGAGGVFIANYFGGNSSPTFAGRTRFVVTAQASVQAGTVASPGAGLTGAAGGTIVDFEALAPSVGGNTNSEFALVGGPNMQITTGGAITSTDATGVYNLAISANSSFALLNSSTTNLPLYIGAAGSGGVLVVATSGGFGYAPGFGNGGTVTQTTSRTTAITLNKICGQFTLFAAVGSATPATFTFNNTTIAATDTVEISEASGTNQYLATCTGISAGTSFTVTFYSMVGTASDSPTFNFKIVRGATN